MKLVDVLFQIDQSKDHSKDYNWYVKGSKTVIEEVVMSETKQKKIWTNDQQNYLDQKFGEVNNRLDKLESDVAVLKQDVAELKQGIQSIIDILARNGMK